MGFLCLFEYIILTYEFDKNADSTVNSMCLYILLKLFCDYVGLRFLCADITLAHFLF